MRFITNICCALVLLFSTITWSQVTFVSEVGRDSIGINERIEVRFTVNQEGDNFNPPKFENFKVVRGPTQSESLSWIDGRTSYNKIYSYYLAPEKKGNLQIDVATFEFEGIVYKSNVVYVKVGNAVEKKDHYGNSTSQHLKKMEEEVFLEREISNTNPFVNEPISVIYKLYVSENFGINVLKESLPEYKNFLIDSINEKVKDFQVKEYKGETYRYVILREVVLVPLKEGELILDSYELNLEIESITGYSHTRHAFELDISEEVRSTGTNIINVKPLSDIKNKKL
ncbi:BatD family protein [Flavobacterium sp. I3-2]|uniref:BatD family protein n=1 Tax=Flavobacterium sp. I3-2 TaxID=2748319 RepID=UPI0015B2F962|nr:BatD family protein [Flavobacterium sp. I3-2]